MLYAHIELWFWWQGDGVETEVTWEDQQNINLFGRLNNKFHDLEEEIKAKKVHISFILFSEIVGNCTKKSGNIFMNSAVNLLH